MKFLLTQSTIRESLRLWLESTPEESADITIGVFFDGTLNNKDNTKTRLAFEKADKTKRLSQEAQIYKNTTDTIEKDLRGSYENDLSNIARMEGAYKENKKGKILQGKVYVEGIGTTIYNEDDEDGMGLGTGPTGIPKKVEKGCINAAKKVKTLFNKSKKDKINMLQIDVFGFSRGAAAARNFVYEITRQIDHPKTIFDDSDEAEKNAKEDEYYKVEYGEFGVQLETNGLKEIKHLSIRFVGLYETVASYGYVHYNDTADLHLNSIRKPKHENITTRMYKTRHVFQLVAQDEHRENFVITNIKSSLGNGVEKFIPGVHSDIGGGYTDNSQENNLMLYEAGVFTWKSQKKAKQIRDFLIEQGWYKPNQLSIDTDYNLILNRVVKSKKYSYVSLHIMVEYAIRKKLLFEFSVISKKYKLTETSRDVTIDGITNNTSLAKIKARLDKHIYDNEPAMDWNNEEDNIIGLNHLSQRRNLI